jgi:YfiH family protein
VENEFILQEHEQGAYFKLPLFKRVRHAFCTRAGEAGALAALDTTPERLLTLRQVHGGEVLVVDDDTRSLALALPQPYDAVVTQKRNIALGIWTADCLPILIADRKKKVIAAVHAGWRGIWQGVIEHTVARMQRTFQSSPADIVAGIGPGIGPCCYEVKEDVTSLFRNAYAQADQFIQERDGKTYLDLRGCARLELIQAGIVPANIAVIDLCTSCRQDLFFSYRRDSNGAGRQLSIILLK